MTSRLVKSYLTAKIYLKKKSDASSLTVYLSEVNLHTIFNTSDVTTNEIIPILQPISGINYEVSDFLPRPQNINVNLDNSFHSMGYGRKFSDLFEFYTGIKQNVEIFFTSYGFNDQPSLSDLFSSSNRVFAGTIESIQNSIGTNILSLNCQSYTLPKTVFSKEITLTDFPNAPSSQLGKQIPIVFASNAFPAIPVDELAVASNHNSGLSSNNVAKYVIANSLKDYPLKAVGLVNTVQDNRLETVAVNAGFNDTAQTNLESAFAFYYAMSNDLFVNVAFSASGSGILTHVLLDVQGDAGYVNPLAGYVQFTIYYRGKKLQEIQIPKTDYPAFTSAGTFTITAPLKDPIFVENFANLGVSITQQDPNGTAIPYSLGVRLWNYGSGGANYKFSGAEGDFPSSTGTNAPRVRYYCASMRFSRTTQSNGFYYEYMTIGAFNGLFRDKLNTMDISVDGQGLYDATGNLTGTTNEIIHRPHHIIQLLMASWTGSEWDVTNNQYDKTRFQSTLESNSLPISVAFFSEGKAFADELIERVLRNSMYKMPPIKPTGTIASNLKTLTLFAYGNVSQNVTRITDEDILSLNYEIRNSQTVVNNVTLLYDPTYLGLDIKSLVTQGGARGYQNSVITNNAISMSLYGSKDLANNQYDALRDATSATNVSTILLGLYQNPLEYYVFEVPYFKYKTLNVCDVIDVCNPNMPSFYGSDPQADLSYYNGVESSEIGTYEMQGKSYRCQIESIVYNLLTSNLPTIRVVARLITNLNDLT